MVAMNESSVLSEGEEHFYQYACKGHTHGYQCQDNGCAASNTKSDCCALDSAFEDGSGARLVAFKASPHRIVYVNNKWIEVFGWTLQEACQSNLLALMGSSQADAGDIQRTMQECSRSMASAQVTGQTKGGASQALSLDIQHLSGYGEYALAAIRVRPCNSTEGSDSCSVSSMDERMCEDSDGVPPSITTSVGSVERVGDSEEDMLSHSCRRVTLRDDVETSSSMLPQGQDSVDCATSPRGEGPTEDVWHEFVAYRDVQLEIPASVRDHMACVHSSMHALRSVEIVQDWDINSNNDTIRIRADLETIEAHVLDCKACLNFLAENPSSDWTRFWRVTSCLHCHLVGCDTAASPKLPAPAVLMNKVYFGEADGSANGAYYNDCLMVEAASDLGFLLS